MVGHSSLFSQLLCVVNRHQFERRVRESGAERAAKGFTCWSQFVAMMFCQLAQAKSLREISDGLACCEGKLNHLGLEEGPKRSTLSYANARRPWQLFESLFYDQLALAQSLAPKKKLRFKNKLLSLDATVIDLCLSMFNWATFRQTKGAVKLHLLLDHDGYLPVYAHLSEGNVHELRVAKSLHFPKGSVVVMDRAYVDYRQFAHWTKAGIFFVTRLKENANYWDFEDRPVPKNSNVLKDQLIRLNPITAGAPCREDLRLVTVWDERNQCEVRLLTNQMHFGASTIAAIYRERWQIELFFKALKQNLKIKTFVGTSANAVRIQIWTALIAILLLKILQFKSTFGWALSNLVALLRWNLFTYRNLWEWINRPYDTPPESALSQGELFELDSMPGHQT
jgi:Transposase DDE domain/Domain of unknown function (DUF4372)